MDMNSKTTSSPNKEDAAAKNAKPNRKTLAAKEGNSELIMGIPVDVQVILGSTEMPVATLMSLGQGSVISLDKQIGDPVDIVVNGRLVARGEVIVMEDDSSKFGVSLTEVLSQ